MLLTFFPMVVGLLDGFAGVPAEATELMRSYGASRRQALRLLRWPAALPSFFTGLRIATTYAMLGRRLRGVRRGRTTGSGSGS